MIALVCLSMLIAIIQLKSQNVLGFFCLFLSFLVYILLDLTFLCINYSIPSNQIRKFFWLLKNVLNSEGHLTAKTKDIPNGHKEMCNQTEGKKKTNLLYTSLFFYFLLYALFLIWQFGCFSSLLILFSNALMVDVLQQFPYLNQ